MFGIAESGDRTAGQPGIGHPHSPELIMHWIDVCTDPAAHRVTAGPTVAANSLTHRDQLAAVWVEQGASLPRTAC